jgi:hypothetical protein
VGGKYGQMKKRTLSNYCHNEIVTIQNAKLPDGSMRLSGCPLYETKDNMSESLEHSVSTAEQFRNFKELGLLPVLDEITAYEFTCFDAAERAVRKINNEISKKQAKEASKKAANQDQQQDPRKTGGFA